MTVTPSNLPPRVFWIAALVFALAAAAGLLGLDQLLAGWTSTLAGGESLWDRGTGWLDLVVLKEMSNFLLGAILLLAGAILLALRATRRLGWATLYLGLVQFLTTTVADLAKPQLGRLRPYEAMAEPGASDVWFVGANSFPSGHTAFYAGLFFPLMLLLPHWAWLWALPPAFIALARILSHDHYLSDVAAALALAAAMTAAWAPLARRADRDGPPPARRDG
jgi:membrane-associated phospholipid phosphatase